LIKYLKRRPIKKEKRKVKNKKGKVFQDFRGKFFRSISQGKAINSQKVLAVRVSFRNKLVLLSQVGCVYI